MNLFKLITEIEQADPEVGDRYRFYSRRNLFKFGSKLAAAGIPTLVVSSLNKAMAAPSQAAIDVANFALKLEYLEATFYNKGLNDNPSFVPTADKAVIQQIAKHENAHVTLLETTLGALAEPKPDFKFPTGTFTDYNTFLGIAQVLEDTGVMAYKGQAGNLINDKDILQVALQIHSVEARHASEIRRMIDKKGWVSDTNPNQPGFMQGTVDLKSLNLGKSDATLREAFDEYLTKEQVLAAAAPFFA